LGLSIYVDAWNHARFIADVVQALPTRLIGGDLL
jgi:hypothetical protein